MSDLKPTDRVVHLADRHRGVRRLGTIQAVWDKDNGVEYARVSWDDQLDAVEHPTANLVRYEP